MASAFLRDTVTGRTLQVVRARKRLLAKGETWCARYKNHEGKWSTVATDAQNYADALAQAQALERAAEIRRKGKARGGIDPDLTFADLAKWWLDNVSVATASHEQDESRVRVHLTGSWFEKLKVAEIARADVERLLRERQQSAGLAPASVNHIRMTILRILEAGIREGKTAGPNIVREVKKRAEPKRLPNYLRHDEVTALLPALSDRWKPLFAAALYLGLRKGELLGLRKADVDLDAGLIYVRHSHGRDVPKGGDEGVVRIPTELYPFLKSAIKASNSTLVFPAPDGTRMREDFPLQDVLHRAMVTAGLVEGYIHKCRKKGCGFRETQPDNLVRRCPKDSMKLWPVAQVRPVRFHDLRHTTASLMVMAGASIMAVSKHLRHADPQITAAVYAHLSPEFQQSEVNRLTFFPTAPSAEPLRKAANAPEPGLVTFLSHSGKNSTDAGLSEATNLPKNKKIIVARDAGFEPATLGFGGQYSIQLS